MDLLLIASRKFETLYTVYYCVGCQSQKHLLQGTTFCHGSLQSGEHKENVWKAVSSAVSSIQLMLLSLRFYSEQNICKCLNCIFAIAKSALSDHYHPYQEGHFSNILIKGINIYHHCLLLTEWAIRGHGFNSSQTTLYFLRSRMCTQEKKNNFSESEDQLHSKIQFVHFSLMIYTVAVYLTGCYI